MSQKRTSPSKLLPKRALSLIVAVAILISALPVQVFALLEIEFPSIGNIDSVQITSVSAPPTRDPVIQTAEESLLGQPSAITPAQAETGVALGRQLAEMIAYADPEGQLSSKIYLDLFLYLLDPEQQDAAQLDGLVPSMVQALLSTGSLSPAEQQQLHDCFDVPFAFLAELPVGNVQTQTAVEVYQKMSRLGNNQQEILQMLTLGDIDQMARAKAGEAAEMSGMSAMAASDDALDSQNQEQVYSAPYRPENNVKEQINLSSGALEYAVTDVVLPGVNGLDLIIGRTYNSSRAKYHDVEATVAFYDYDVGRYRGLIRAIRLRCITTPKIATEPSAKIGHQLQQNLVMNF